MNQQKVPEIKYVPTTCPFCGVGCGLNLVVKDGKVVGVEPWKRSPVNEGKLCPKGYGCYEFIHSPDRLTKPLIKKDGKFVEASWDEALDLVASKLKEVYGKYGPDALAFQVSCRVPNEECYLMNKLARVGFKTNNVDNCARICHGPSVAGLSLSLGSGAATNPFADLLNADCIFVIGSNAMEAHPLVGRRLIQAKEKGTTLIVADPRYTLTARKAHIYMRFNPSTVIPLINSMMYWIIKEGKADMEFIKNKTKDFEELKKTVEKYADVEALTGTPTELVKEIALKYASAKNAAIVYCLGITETTSGTDNVRSLANLAMLTGNIGRPGTGINPLRGQNNVQGACDMGAYPNVYSGYQKVELEENRKKMEQAWGVEGLPGNYGLTLMEQIDACGDRVKAMFMLGENPMISFPDINHVRECLSKLEFSVVEDIFLTETAQLADVVLPAACWAEKDGTFTSGERRVQRVRKAVDAPGEAKPDWEILSLLGQKLGLKGFDFKSAEEVFNDMARVTPQYGGMTYARLEKPEALVWPCPTADHPGTPILHTQKFATADGLGNFFGIDYKPPAEVPDEEYPFALMTGRLLFHYHSGTQTRRSKQLHNEVPTGFVEISEADAAELGIKKGDRVLLKSRRGEVETNALVTKDIPKGVLNMTFHFRECPANLLTNTARDPLSKMPELKYCAVSVEKVKAR
ncbi:formate dehydrogenase subunit alpha [Methanocella sp. CWC-04]|uniref:formate dehydrogenase (coenzyme F420) n=1 Tax=Methanooceanicella nereidis TaxID=2052831 RepID=A0AAP2W6D8_9EURY|nr:formate dehydrogenase subunit alpha [Methanocella sp. CWC-04]MCD1293981.1 formate dehydrogenase subunit alpha [Methanocella sp. CWC-04]